MLARVRFLHERKILHRDIKPDNFAFDADGTAKLIDFGLAKELKDSEKMVNGKYRLTGNTGVWRYMAPEIAKEWAYDMSVDTYSFGILWNAHFRHTLTRSIQRWL